MKYDLISISVIAKVISIYAQSIITYKKVTVCIGCHGNQVFFCLFIIFISFSQKLISEQCFGTGKCITKLNMGLLCIDRTTRSHIFLTPQNTILWHDCYDIYHSNNTL